MAAGLGFKTFVTGEVLTAGDTNGYLMQGVLVFASAAARDAAITSPQEGQCCYLKDTDAVLTYSGSAWVGFDDSNAIQNSIVDAKGDLVAASAADTPARLAVGSNGETLVADSSTSTGLRWNTTPTIGNPIINGGLDIWQRGTSFTSPVTGTFTADRWNSINTGAATTTITRQTTSDTTNLPFIQYCIRYQRTSGQTATGSLYLTYGMENSMSTPFIGKTVTLSFYARAGANYSPTSSLLQVRGVSGTGTDQNINSGFTGGIDFISSTATLTTTWQRFTYTATVSSSATQLAFYVFAQPGGTAGAADYYEITGSQYDVGSVALPFRRSGGTIQGELAACQRYYLKSYNQETAPATASNSVGNFQFQALSATPTASRANVRFPVTMRTSPTITVYSTNSGTSAKLYNEAAAVDLDALTQYIGQTGFTVYPNSGTPTLGNPLLVHYVASAEL